MKKEGWLIAFIIICGLITRLSWLGSIPNSLYTDEASQGYNAYSILKTGRDEHGAFLPVSIRSFGDWKPPLGTYLMIPYIAILGLSEMSVRLPSAILSICQIYLTILLVKEIGKGREGSKKRALLTGFFLTVSPWHILQSRAAMLVAPSLFFLTLGIYLFIKSKARTVCLPFSLAAFILSVYGYYGMRIVTPAVILVLMILYFDIFRKSLENKKILFTAVAVSIIGFSPLITAFIKEPDVIFGRARTVSIFYDQGARLRLWELTTQDGINRPIFLVRSFHNSVYQYTRAILYHFASHFSPGYLFLTGDNSPPFRVPGMGILYLQESLLVLLGFYLLLKEKNKGNILMMLVFLISFIPASLTFMTPSSNRTFTAILPISFFISTGLYYLVRKYRLMLIILFVFAYTGATAYFFRQYFLVLPLNHADVWNFGWKETVDYVSKNEKYFNDIYISDNNGMPYIYFLFYNRYDPGIYMSEGVRTYVPDVYGFEHVESFSKYIFIRDFEWKNLKNNLQKNSLYVIPSDQTGGESGFHTVKSPDGKSIIEFFKYGKN